MAAIVKYCTCTSEYQDKTYGKNQRVHNTLGKSESKSRCATCGKTK